VEPDSRFVIAIPSGLKFSPNLPMQSRRREALLDPRIYAAPTQPDFAPDSSSGDEGVDYLSRLKRAVVEAAPADAGARGGGEAPAAANNLPGKSPRLRCSGSAEFRVEGTDAPMWGTIPTSACTDAMWK
jgi:hypothetical protein